MKSIFLLVLCSMLNFTSHAEVPKPLNLHTNAEYLLGKARSFLTGLADKLSGKESFCAKIKSLYGDEKFFIAQVAPWNVCKGQWVQEHNGITLEVNFKSSDPDCGEQQEKEYKKGLECFRYTKAP